jgi:CHAT domain-containing protein
MTCLGPNVAIVNPLVIEGRVFVFVARNQGSIPVFQFEETAHDFLPLLDSLRRWDEVYQMHIRRGDDERRWITDGHAIFDETMDSVSQIAGKSLQDLINEGFSKLVFIPDDLLGDVPFHATNLQPSGRLLIDECEVSYAPSLYMLWECCRRQSKDVRSRRGVALKHILDPTLSSAMDEALEVATDLGGNLDVINPLRGAFWSDLSNAEVLHVVAHGKHQPLLPINSIFLQGWVDLPLSTFIAGLDLPRCDLVSNLICESAMPAIRKTPAVDFSSVFLTAGARTVLASTWVVDDSLASEMARRFFKFWVDGASPAVSFRRGLSDLRAGRKSLSAFEWAGMRLIGAPNN